MRLSEEKTLPARGRIIATIVPDDARFLDVARNARRLGLLLATNGMRCIMARRVPPGWTQIRSNEARLQKHCSLDN